MASLRDTLVKLYAAEEEKLRLAYQQELKELSERRDAIEAVCIAYDLDLCYPIPLPEFRMVKIDLPVSTYNIVPLHASKSEGTCVEIYNYSGRSIILNLQNGKITHRRDLSRGQHPRRLFEGKRVSFGRDIAGETEDEIRLKEEYNERSFLYRHTDGSLKYYHSDLYFRTDGRIFRKEEIKYLDCCRIVALYDVEKGTKEMLLIGYGTLFRYRNEWYQYKEDGTIFHCRSHSFVPCVFGRNRKVHSENDIIFIADGPAVASPTLLYPH